MRYVLPLCGLFRSLIALYSLMRPFHHFVFLSFLQSLSLSLSLSLSVSLSLSLSLSLFIYLSLSFFLSFSLSFLPSFLPSFLLSFFPSFLPFFFLSLFSQRIYIYIYIYILTDHIIFQGHFVSGKYEGVGKFVWPNGMTLESSSWTQGKYVDTNGKDKDRGWLKFVSVKNESILFRRRISWASLIRAQGTGTLKNSTGTVWSGALEGAPAILREVRSS